MHRYSVIKSYGHELGLSCCFRQHRAQSHCSRLHGYALAFEFLFAADRLDANGWVVDFGGLKPLREALVAGFDHTLLAAQDDPELPRFEAMADAKLVDLRVLPRTGCEYFAESAWHLAQGVVQEVTDGRTVCLTASCAEHGANRACYAPPDPAHLPPNHLRGLRLPGEWGTNRDRKGGTV